jgi:hypothetical protein
MSQAGLLDLYQSPWVLIRPDQMVAWGGDADADPAAVWQQVLGHARH